MLFRNHHTKTASSHNEWSRREVWICLASYHLERHVFEKKKTFLMVQRDQRHSETASTAAEEFSDPSNHHPLHHGVWKSQKSLIQHCERSELRLPFEWTKVNEKCQLWRLFENLKACGQAVLQDRSLLIGHKLVKNAKIRDSNETFWVD